MSTREYMDKQDALQIKLNFGLIDHRTYKEIWDKNYRLFYGITKRG